ncbi:Putative UDP-2,3-diacylglucosamine hydrolase [Desulfonema limicola]|uniref:UDP-2,3-diacylglucosamine hydrolase n=1 Tax=Desulfonema limicola TaxID=45656 RepID=A0A975BEF1_9BACT|nr:metallophosphoesterase [Desulfonema limicola]QTA83926.1 Putative UDP-2,3-diacylglucosamine hydrolase [Desulfonema limicola]
MIIIADSHVSNHLGNTVPFFNMLEAFEKNNHDIVFLGDIFDLWIALPGYEDKIHKDFLTWCKDQKKYRTIGFIEGNHEFFLAEQKKDFFSWCTDLPWYQDGNACLFCHGDTINQKDKGYLLFKNLIKNPVVKFILMRLSCGPELTLKIRNTFKKRNSKIKKYLPETEIRNFGKSMFHKGIKTIFTGHFHQEYLICREDRRLYILNDWFSTQKICLYDKLSKKIKICHWSEIAS